MIKSELVQTIDQSVQEVIDWYNSYPDDKFTYVFHKGKWTAGQHLLHLVKSGKAANSGFKVSKLALRMKFGIRKHEESTYQKMYEFYLAKSKETKFVAPQDFEPGPVSLEDKKVLLNKLVKEMNSLKTHTQNWSEKNLSKYVVPHPIFGNMTMRELVMFTSFHNGHHLRILERDYIS